MRTILLVTKTDSFRKAGKIAGLIAAAQARSCRVQYFNPQDTKIPFAKIRNFIRPDGIVVEGTSAGRLDTRGLPVVYLDANVVSRRCRHSVRLDADTVARLAFDELTAVRPASAVFASAFGDSLWSQLREKAFLRLCGNGGIDARSVSCPHGHVRELWKRLPDVFRRAPRPIAVFAANDETAESVYLAAERAGVAIPSDLSVVSVDDDPLRCRFLDPPLSSIIQNPYEAGQAAANLLIRLMDDPKLSPEHLVIPPVGLVRRASSASPNSASVPAADRINAYVRRHALDPDVSNTSVATALGLSRHTMERPFRARFGKSVHAAIIDRRFAEVERLLLLPTQLMDPIANLCGWRSSAHLKRAFRQRYGITMSDWRRLHHC